MLTDPTLRALLSVDSIEQLLWFLERELHWPISSANVDDVTFQYEPEELGLKEDLAPKVNKIYQIRPPTRETPWGIFFIDFENKKLPVTLMRRILNHLRIKKRGPQTGQGWDASDLLFMTTYGEKVDGMREVAFAHFHQAEGDLPTLNVLQWDTQDTPAKLQQTYSDLRANLRWPPDTADKQAWRRQWARPFRHGIGHTIRTAKGLAEALADLSKKICERCKEVLEAETESGPMTKLFKAFKEALIHDLKPEDFADTFAQTVSYGLLTAAFSRTDWEGGASGTVIHAEDLARLVPITNPFLKEILETFLDVGGRKKGGIDFDELGVQEVVELLRSEDTDLPAIRNDFMSRNPGEDPVIRFYEDYLAAYNKKLKVQRGVFYTPQPVVSYIVRSVHELLQTEFGIEDGLASTITWREMAAKPLPPAVMDRAPEEEGAGDGGSGLNSPQPTLDGMLADQPKLGDQPKTPTPQHPNTSIQIPEGTPPDSPFVVILDPAVGTATFLVEVIDVIWNHLQRKWGQDRAGCIGLLRLNPQSSHPQCFPDFWNAYVPEHLLPRLYGFELMMAPYAIAHMKMGLKLGETGYRFATDKRVRIYLTNSLEPASELQARLALDWEALAHEAQAVTAIKQTERFTIVIGNPPYSKLSSNSNDWITHAMARFKTSVAREEIQRQALSNDYVKFFALYSLIQESSGLGVLGVITDNSYLDGPLFRDLRSYLRNACSLLAIVDLGGNTRKRGALVLDENVFDIQQGVAIVGAVRGAQTGRGVQYARLCGARASKQAALTSAGWRPPFQQLPASPPITIFVPRTGIGDEDWRNWWALPSVFAGGFRMGRHLPFNGAALATRHDEFAVSFTPEELELKIDRFFDPAESCQSLNEAFSLCTTSHFDFNSARKRLTAQQAKQ
ncbi:MAG TPA: N-6 DNA methylase, partial [Fimbriimonadaceae bacterium]|nr:N-6 DNA methylase [Fimbriimonadaceae bacterium]